MSVISNLFRLRKHFPNSMNFCTKLSDLTSLLFLNFLAFLLQTQIIQGQVNLFEDDDECEIICGTNITHTSCLETPNPDCDIYTVFNLLSIPSLSDGKVLNLLIDGHNGLRDRIADKMSVANMVKLTWDSTLADMALRYFQKCTPDADDPCTHFIADDLTCVELLEYKEKDVKTYRFISQNRFKIRADYLPKYFVEEALRSWYYEKSEMQKPTYNDSVYQGSTVGVLQEETNFTHLAFPLLSFFGCGIAQIDEYFELICNYYPYYRIPDGAVIFINGSAATSCPAFYPIRSEFFIGLCCDGQELWAKTDEPALAWKLMPASYQYILLLVLSFY